MKKTIGILLISTGKYHIFLQPLIDGIDKYFFKGYNIEVYLFTDRNNELRHSSRINIVQIPTEHKPFPYPTLKRYEFFSKAADIIKSGWLFYLDVDMAIISDVGEEILPDGINDEGLVATLHPGFYKGGGSWCTDENSLAYTPVECRKKYYAGGFQGGVTESYLNLCKSLSHNISEDEKKGVMAEWHDESHFNAYMGSKTPKTLLPEYCMVEQENLRVLWGINDFVPKIIALSKDHKKLR